MGLLFLDLAESLLHRIVAIKLLLGNDLRLFPGPRPGSHGPVFTVLINEKTLAACTTPLVVRWMLLPAHAGVPDDHTDGEGGWLGGNHPRSTLLPAIFPQNMVGCT